MAYIYADRFGLYIGNEKPEWDEDNYAWEHTGTNDVLDHDTYYYTLTAYDEPIKI